MITFEQCFHFVEWVNRNGFVFNSQTGEWMFNNYGTWTRIAKTTDELFFEIYVKEIDQT